MDALQFSIKRVYWSGHARLRELFIPLGITPARADLLRVVAIHEHGIGQSTLTQQLGVTRPTISKMLTAMVEKGWVERIELEDGSNLILATRAGLVLIAQVIQRFLLSGAVPLRMAMAWGHGLAEKLRATLYRLLNRARRAFLDRAPFLHPWRKEATYVRRKYTIWEARLRADDIDDTVAEDIELIRKRAKEPIACAPPPRSWWEVENIDAQRRHDAAAPPMPTSSIPSEDVERQNVEREEGPTPPTKVSGATTEAASASAAETAAEATGKAGAEGEASDAGEADEEIPPELAALWKNLVELGSAAGVSLDDVPRWDEPE